MTHLDISIKIGGEAGQGIQTVGDLLARTCREAGLHVMGINDFESRIRGGHSFFQLRICTQDVQAPCHELNLLVAMDQNTVVLHQEELIENGLILKNGEEKKVDGNTHTIPFVDLAKEAGNAILANTIAAGSVLSLLGVPFDIFRKVLEKHFAKATHEVIESNFKAAHSGYKAMEGVECPFRLTVTSRIEDSMLISGSLAFALGALAGDCRFVSFYPMSPATSIMEHLASYQSRFPLVVEQAEDEIAAVNMIIGASFAGTRSLTATSGGGFCLMTEGLGLAGITETPIVIINCQRPGPATGLPTRTAQGDLQFVIRAAQDDFPRFVFAPGSPQEAYGTTIRALDLSEKYQTPAIILSDQFLNDSLFFVKGIFHVPEEVERYVEHSPGRDRIYLRYGINESGISPRALPGKVKALVLASGNEHSEDGHITEDATLRNAMVHKRDSKMSAMTSEMRGPKMYHGDSKVLLVGWGSTEGILMEAVDMLRKKHRDVGAVHFCDIWPFPAQSALDGLSEAEHLFVVEQNSTGQFTQLLRQETGLEASEKILKYDGRPFYPIEVVKRIEKYME